MFACLSGRSPSTASQLTELARQFSPLIERISEEEVVFSLRGLQRLFGDPFGIAAAISRSGERMGLSASLAIAANIETAVLAARNIPGVTILLQGQEAGVLGPLPVDALRPEPELLTTLQRWGVSTLEQLAALPEAGVRERLGEAGSRLRRLALGCETRLLRVDPPTQEYTAQQDLDHPIELIEPLLFHCLGAAA